MSDNLDEIEEELNNGSAEVFADFYSIVNLKDTFKLDKRRKNVDIKSWTNLKRKQPNQQEELNGLGKGQEIISIWSPKIAWSTINLAS